MRGRIGVQTAAALVRRPLRLCRDDVWHRRPDGLDSRKVGARGAAFSAAWDGPARRLAKQNPFAGYTPSSHDVFVATFAKSGTNWMMQIVHQLLFHGQGEYDHIHDVVPWPETRAMGPLSKYTIPVEDPAVWMASPEHKRVIKTHLDWELIPYSEEARYIVVIRDPKDIFVSSYFFFVQSGFLEALHLSLDFWYRVCSVRPLPDRADPGQPTPPLFGPSAIARTFWLSPSSP